jgi:hypothetical protein
MAITLAHPQTYSVSGENITISTSVEIRFAHSIAAYPTITAKVCKLQQQANPVEDARRCWLNLYFSPEDLTVASKGVRRHLSISIDLAFRQAYGQALGDWASTTQHSVRYRERSGIGKSLHSFGIEDPRAI